jgi:glucose-1-phosphate thymidylyltransferase
MNILILAAGYATRLYPLTLTKAKPLLEVAGKPMMEWVIDHLAGISGISKVFVVTNNKFAADFEAWADGYNRTHAKLPFSIVNDGSTSDEDKLGAIGDLNHVIQKHGIEDEDLLVVAGDNLFSESLAGFAELAREKNAPALGVFDVGSLEQAKKFGVVAVNGEGVITQFVEKPAEPPSTLIGIALYYYPRHVVPLVRQYLAEGNNPDQPGRFVQWLYPRTPVHTWRVPGTWFDVGSRETLEEANRIFAEFTEPRA